MEEKTEIKGNTPAEEESQHHPAGERKGDGVDTSQAAEDLQSDSPSPEMEDATLESQNLINKSGTNAEIAEDLEDFLEDMISRDNVTTPEGSEPEEAAVTDKSPGTEKSENETSSLDTGETTAPAPLPKAAFRSWKNDSLSGKSSLLAAGLQKLSSRSRSAEEEEEMDFDDDYPDEEIEQFAQRSIVEDQDIASETLALVLEKQEHYEKAISMYERLLLQNPEKSSFFAAKIQNLKNKL